MTMGISLQESTTQKIPHLLEAIVKNVTLQNKTPDSIQKDYLLILLIVAMIEDGFVPVDGECEILDINLINAEQINKWKSKTGVFEVPHIMTGFKDTSVKLIMSPLGAIALVNVVIKDVEAGTYTICLPLSKYVVAPQATTIPMIFRELKHFSESLKNKVLSAVKSRILDYHGYASASLMGLPEELLYKIMFYLPVKNILNVSRTCMRLRELLQSNSFWHAVVKRDFVSNRDMPPDSNFDWKALYKTSYLDDSQNAATTAGSFHDYVEFSDYLSYMDNPIWNVLL